MHIAKSAAVVFCIFTSYSHAQTVVVNSNVAATSPGILGTVALTVQQNAVRTDYTSAWFNYDGRNLSFATINLDEGSDWYVVQPGDIFSPATIQAGLFPPLVTFSEFNYPPVNVGRVEFYLGVSTGQGFDIPEDRTAFGWVHLRRVNQFETRLMMVENVMSYDSPGIIVGTAAGA
jgi:hypothetical protein